MAVHCVSYDLNKSGQNYSELYEELKKSPGYWHHLDSTWLVSTTETASQLFARLKPYIDDNDTMLVIKVTNEYSGWLPEGAWNWLRQQL